MEWRAAICLCGMRQCRGSFLHFSTQTELQQVLNRYCSPLYRFASLAKSCTEVGISNEADALFKKYGMLKYAVGENAPEWLRKYAYEILRFVEYERCSLPSALLRGNMKSANPLPNYSFANADAEGRCVMESRLQAMVITFSVVRHLLSKQREHDIEKGDSIATVPPVKRLEMDAAVSAVWTNMKTIPDLLMKHLVGKHKKKTKSSVGKVESVETDMECPVDSKYSENVDVEMPKATEAIKQANNLKLEKDCSMTKEEKNTSKVLGVVTRTREILATEPKNYSELCTSILSIRESLLGLISMSTPRVRIQQLCDILVLWAVTHNFISVTDYESVECNPVKVFARELGNNIPRSSIISSTVPEREIIRIPCPVQPSERKQMSPIQESNYDTSFTNGDQTQCHPLVHPSLNSPVNGLSSLPSTGNCCDSIETLTPEVNLDLNISTDSATPDVFGDSRNNALHLNRLSTSSLETVVDEVKLEHKASVWKDGSHSEIFEPNEVVHVDTFTYNSRFMLWQVYYLQTLCVGIYLAQFLFCTVNGVVQCWV